jgi:hypothetical protein
MSPKQTRMIMTWTHREIILGHYMLNLKFIPPLMFQYKLGSQHDSPCIFNSKMMVNAQPRTTPSSTTNWWPTSWGWSIHLKSYLVKEWLQFTSAAYKISVSSVFAFSTCPTTEPPGDHALVWIHPNIYKHRHAPTWHKDRIIRLQFLHNELPRNWWC